MRKLCSKWVQRLLTVNQKQHCVDDSERYLQQFQHSKKEFFVDMLLWMKRGSPTSLQSQIGSQLSKQQQVKAVQGDHRSVGKILASVFWDAQGILFIDYLEKGWIINSEYYIALLVCLKEEIAKKRPQLKKKKCSFTKTMHCVTSRSQRWQNYMNCTSNCFRTHPFLQIWPPATTGCLQTTKECSRERDLAPMKKWYRKLRRILRPKTNCSIKKVLSC